MAPYQFVIICTISILACHFDPTGFAFIYMEDERDAEDAIRRLDRIEFGRKGRRIRVEWTKVLQAFEHSIEILSFFPPYHFPQSLLLR